MFTAVVLKAGTAAAAVLLNIPVAAVGAVVVVLPNIGLAPLIPAGENSPDIVVAAVVGVPKVVAAVVPNDGAPPAAGNGEPNIPAAAGGAAVVAAKGELVLEKAIPEVPSAVVGVPVPDLPPNTMAVVAGPNVEDPEPRLNAPGAGPPAPMEKAPPTDDEGGAMAGAAIPAPPNMLVGFESDNTSVGTGKRLGGIAPPAVAVFGAPNPVVGNAPNDVAVG